MNIGIAIVMLLFNYILFKLAHLFLKRFFFFFVRRSQKKNSPIAPKNSGLALPYSRDSNRTLKMEKREGIDR